MATLPDTGGLARRFDGVASSPVRDLLALTARPEVISFAGGLPAPELFDVDGLREAYAEVLGGPAARRALQYASTEGDADLRATLADRLTRRGLATGPDELLVTSGSQQGLTLLATALLDPGDVVAFEAPTYLAALQAFALAGAVPAPVASDEDGVVPASLEEVLRRERPKLLYLCPTFANPTGRTLTAERRAEVAELCVAHGTWLVEDDPYGELRYRGAPLAPLAAQPAAAGNAVHLGSLSKVMAPGLRLGYVRAPAALRRTLVVAKQAADLHTSTIDQAAAATYLAAHDLDEHTARLAGAYRERRDAMLAALARELPDGPTWNEPDGGMFVWLRLPEGGDATRLLAAALERDVAFVPGVPFYPSDPDPRTLRLSFTTYAPAQIDAGVTRLAAAVRAG